ncbi:Sporulation protein RMD1 [Fulvia fulva]|uniref:Sporulation protein RMD1 n=1 Tax=Passalora fulva TaxID=5499 RepID=A0A9Q8P979_PASFU|nr:Sporulation protein RMD1 [Fulvia fulva]KAK4624273.1 Sporulation protein RMD1 [Fulvia fulva]KAK4625480.1 Sporulation protein RMD1 [Fulvia fulva]UJO17777.1 Sporulation protein RMD1 [Fulvia fulva]WPV15502.1 Sporulation protein RMD1 [Fulvia fulva]WPV29765.1 Sporulation protein RMD1 [Fulvia fulva]
MASSSQVSEASPLLRNDGSSSRPVPSPKPARNVTFNPQVSTSSPPKRRPNFPAQSSNSTTNLGSAALQTSGQDRPGPLATLNSKLRRRNSSGSALALPPSNPASKIGPQRTSRTAQKLKLLPNPDVAEDGPDEESGREVYSQFTRIKDPTARRDAARLGKDDRAKLPRVTAYCTAGSYRLDDLMRFLKGRTKTKNTNPKLFDECIYSPYTYRKEARNMDRRRRMSGDQEDQPDSPQATRIHSQPQRRFSDSALEVEENTEQRREDIIDFNNAETSAILDEGEPIDRQVSIDDANIISEAVIERRVEPDLDTTVHIPEIFLFEYGVVVLWGMSLKEEQRFLKEISKFEQEKLAKDDVQTEEFNFYYTREYQARIYNDFISLREKRNYMTKLAISHALAQSVKTSLYEDLVDATISTTQNIPSQIATTGRINLTRKQINMQIGELFILRINIHLQGSVLDAPELMWAEPQLDPVYQAVRSYLEMDQRVALLQERVSVIADLLAVLKDQLSHTHGEYLEWIVIVLIAAEIFVAGINIVVDLYAGVD